MACVITLAGAVMPPSEGLQLLPWDKAEHFLAFYVLTSLAVVAFPRGRLIMIAIVLSAFGGLIELVQALPIVHRDAAWGDWVADTVAVAAVFVPMALMRWRVEFGR